MNKKSISKLLIGTMLIASLTGCGSKNSDKSFDELVGGVTETPTIIVGGTTEDLTGGPTDPDTTEEPTTEAEPQDLIDTIQWETYNDGWFQINYPAGWKVESGYVIDAGAHAIHAYDPNNPDLQVYYTYGQMWFDDYNSQIFMEGQIGGDIYTYLGYLNGDISLVGLFQSYERIQETGYGQVTNLTPMYNFTYIADIGKNSLNYDMIAGAYLNADGKKVDGIFSAGPIININDGYYYTDFPYGFPSVSYVTAPEDISAEWLPICQACLGSLTFTEEYVSELRRLNDSMISNFYANQAFYEATNAIIMDNWYQLSGLYDIIIYVD